MPARELDSGSCSPSIPSVSQSKSRFINPYPDFEAALFMFGEFGVLGRQQSSGNPEILLKTILRWVARQRRISQI
ncbi:hypothetical protein L596_009219 [Steinernema carpocapsae]|uniref:Uncharacterized protein n=1 Tax=Steinernema carpocapsae TaxID=34508 RepID=A0A4U5PFX6_STECR|nr:hypothetical protein L596_009219 [Steinernema carpocapsae]